MLHIKLLYRSSLRISFLISILLLTLKADAFSKNFRNYSNVFTTNRTLSISNLEQRIRRSLISTHSNETGKNAADSSVKLDQIDLFYMTKVWDKIDNNIRTAYVKSLEIPDTLSMYVSPGKHFEVYYNSKPIKSKLQADNIGYGTSGNWRQKTNLPNGIPDYVDEIAWSMDSSWSMEVEQFKFQPPIPFTDPVHNSSRYKVVTYTGGKIDYGQTAPSEKSNTGKGWASIIQLNTDWDLLGYEYAPENAIRVTCAHEFFHSIQYAMVENTDNFDDFPFSWLEGTATSMEELAFPYVNDYLQYTNYFFQNPSMSFIHDISIVNAIYTNSILSLYIFQHSLNAPDIFFIRSVFYNNFKSNIAFYENLEITANQIGTTWVDLLNRFHTASFFTGNRSDTSIFLSDAPFFESWQFKDTSVYYVQLEQNINPYAMGIYNYNSSIRTRDTLIIQLQNKSFNSTLLDKSWAASIILQSTGKDSILPIKLDSNGNGAALISPLTNYKNALVIVTNGDAIQSKMYSVTFDNCRKTHTSGEMFSVNEEATDRKSSANINIISKSDVYCDMSLSVSQKQQLIYNAKVSGLAPLSSIYNLVFPDTWVSETDRQFTILIPGYSDTNEIGLYCWNTVSKRWNQVNFSFSTSGDTLSLKTSNPPAGEYAVFKSGIALSIDIYPNPVSLRSKVLNFEGAQIKDVYIYDVNGTLIYKLNNNSENEHTVWNLNNSSNRTIVPGYYLAVINYLVPTDRKVKTTHKRLMVIP